MIKNKSHDIHATEESFRFHLKKRAVLMSVLIVSGLAILIWLNIGNRSGINEAAHEREFTDGFFWGYAIAVVLAGSVRLVKTLRCMKLPEVFQKAYTEYVDERNQFVLMKSYYYSAYIFISLTALAIIVINLLGMPPVISGTLAACIGVFTLILTVTYRIMNRKY